MNFKQFGRTAQLFDYQTGTPTVYKFLDENGTEIEATEEYPWYITDYIPIPDGVLSVTLSKIGGNSPAMCAYDASKNYITGKKYGTVSAVTKVNVTLTSSTPIHFIRFSYFLGSTGYDDLSTKMLNTGSTALPYQPYKDWTDTPHYIHKTATDTLTLPAVIYPNDTSITVGLKGNEEHTGTPSPQNPVMPNGTGERTENLYNASSPNIFNGYYNATTNTLLSSPNNAFIYIPLVQGRKYYVYGCIRSNPSTTIRWATTSATPYYNIPCIRTGQFAQTDIFTITADANENYLAIFLCGDSDYSAYGTVEDAIATNGANLVIDNGYKIPISINNNTTNIYIGDNPLRKSLDGTAYDTLAADGTLTRRVDSDGSVLVTPVVSQITMPSFNTIDGANTITVDTTVQPSEFTATWTGWHDSTVKEWDGSQWD